MLFFQTSNEVYWKHFLPISQSDAQSVHQIMDIIDCSKSNLQDCATNILATDFLFHNHLFLNGALTLFWANRAAVAPVM